MCVRCAVTWGSCDLFKGLQTLGFILLMFDDYHLQPHLTSHLKVRGSENSPPVRPNDVQRLLLQKAWCRTWTSWTLLCPGLAGGFLHTGSSIRAEGEKRTPSVFHKTMGNEDKLINFLADSH